MDRFLLDTQVLYLAYLGRTDKLSIGVRALLGDPDTDRMISSVSVVEIAVKHAIGKLHMNEEATHEAIRDLKLTELPFDAAHAFQMFSLPMHHRDPFDRMILATAVTEKMPIVTGDRIFRKYAGVKILW